MARKAHKKKREELEPSWGELLGGTLAFAQDTVDSAVGWGFEKLKETGDKPTDKRADRHPAAQTAENVARAAASFIGDVGASFYATYDALKEAKRKKKRARKSKNPK
ncbi:MAG: hypothetical protein COB53_06110 [Elusimicrobia bacterium]|nr:MAG: hypothetical protein COB53_06110 [Elusimicrobiota bacterium]